MKSHHTLVSLAAAAALSLAGAAMAGSDPDHAGHDGHGKHDEANSETVERTAEGVGVIQAIAEDGSSVLLAHQPIPELRWPAMTMELALADPALAAGLEVDAEVDFVLHQVGATDYEIGAISPTGAP